MFFKIVINYLMGYACIGVEGYFIERFMNICKSKGIFLWNVKRKNSSFLYANLAMKDFKRIRPIAKTTKCHVRIEEKKGLPFLWHRYQKRKLFFGFLIFMMLFIFAISQFVWNIEVIGNKNIDANELIHQLQEYGLEVGKLKTKINTKELIQKIRLERDDLAWFGIRMLGTNAIIEVVEADPKPEIVPEEEYCNIVSNQNGVITKMNVQNGTAVAKVGDIVTKGTTLVGGWLEGKYTRNEICSCKSRD